MYQRVKWVVYMAAGLFCVYHDASAAAVAAFCIAGVQACLERCHG